MTNIPSAIAHEMDLLSAMIRDDYRPAQLASAGLAYFEGKVSAYLILELGGEYKMAVLERTNDDGEYEPQLYNAPFDLDPSNDGAVLSFVSTITNENEDKHRVSLGEIVEDRDAAVWEFRERMWCMYYGYSGWVTTQFQRPTDVGGRLVIEP